MDAFNNASLRTNINSGATFLSPPKLPHGLNSVMIGHDVTTGRNVPICQQVIISEGGNISIRDNVLISAVAKIVKGAKIGNNVNIRANCFVFKYVRDTSSIILQKTRII